MSLVFKHLHNHSYPHSRPDASIVFLSLFKSEEPSLIMNVVESSSTELANPPWRKSDEAVTVYVSSEDTEITMAGFGNREKNEKAGSTLNMLDSTINDELKISLDSKLNEDKMRHNEDGHKPTEQSQDRIEHFKDESQYPHGLKLSLIIIAICLSVFLVALDQTIIAPALGAITEEYQSVKDIVRLIKHSHPKTHMNNFLYSIKGSRGIYHDPVLMLGRIDLCQSGEFANSPGQRLSIDLLLI